MNNSRALLASAGMVLAAAVAAGGLMAWSASPPAAPVSAEAPAEVVVEYVDPAASDAAPIEVEAPPVTAGDPPPTASPPSTEAEPVMAMVENEDDEYEDDEYEDDDD